ncbi:hypothetical protein AKJ40_03655 [candidate division MSBL1 archaeon SCGC-AAA259M10]|uniref:Calcineurin-like phosphoesterase domain-containing protein n=1 Tax=candidate division MSBL1 archaeon SCGC-AAA259M10 TaxID=1698270 RepID=A0A133UYF2_9EURY|nr:hypothetical protein AKJ40_03655 [candidate division MSBL1 archaeon SCGC-AAA259M10]
MHLQEGNPKTIQALKNVLDTAKKEKADLVTVSGDLFHSREDAEVLRPRLRDIFTDNPFKVLAIPGNHDEGAYRGNLDWGPDLEVATEKPFEVREFGDHNLVALPFQDELTTELYDRVKEVSEELSGGVLLLHCTLDIGYSAGSFGEEETVRYFPVTSSVLSEWDFDFILAGHFHGSTDVRKLDNGGEFIYPGSPVSLSWSEIGRRRAVLLDLAKGDREEFILNTFYRDMFNRTIRPGGENEFIEEAEDWLRERSEENCHLRVIPEGHITVDETEFRESLENVCKGADISHEGYENVEKVLNHTLFKRFKKTLDSKEEIENEEEVESKVIEAMSRLLARRELRS